MSKADNVFESQQAHRSWLGSVLAVSRSQLTISTSLHTRAFEAGSAEIASGLTLVNGPTQYWTLADASPSISAA